MNVLLSIKPKYAQAIVDGEKLFEFRRKIFRDKSIERVYLYATAPISRVVCSFTICRILVDHPKELWDRVGDYSGTESTEYFKYFENCSKAYAIEIADLKIFSNPIDPKVLISGFVPPRSFRYIDGQFSNVKIS